MNNCDSIFQIDLKLHKYFVYSSTLSRKLFAEDEPMATIQAPVGVTVVMGGQWGDEGKGKLVDLLAEKADYVCRCQVCLVGANMQALIMSH